MRAIPALFLSLSMLSVALPARAEAPKAESFSIEQTVLRMPLAEGIGMDEAVESMMLRANMLNMKFVAHQPLHKELAASGIESRRLEIFQFCNPITARKMVDSNALFAAYMPCRIALVENPDGSADLMMMDLNMVIQGAALNPELAELAQQVNDALTEIMTAGANGEL